MLNTRKPTGKTPAPFIILEGAEKSGKTFSAAKLTASDKIEKAYWFDVGEGAADQYGAIPGTDYDVIMHDGSYAQILDQVLELTKLPGVTKDGKFNMVIFDSMSNLWELLKREADAKAREKSGARPDVEVTITMDLWNRAAARLRKIMDLLISWDGIKVVTARGKEVVTLNEKGFPSKGAPKTYKLEGHKSLPYDADVIVRMISPGVAQLTGARSLYVNADMLYTDIPNFEEIGLEGLIFNILKVGKTPIGHRDLKADNVDPNLINAEGLHKVKTLGQTLVLGLPGLKKIYEDYAVNALEELTTTQADKLISELETKVKALEEGNFENVEGSK